MRWSHYITYIILEYNINKLALWNNFPFLCIFFLRYIRECYVFNNTIFLTRLKEVNRYYTHNYHFWDGALTGFPMHRFKGNTILMKKIQLKFFFVIMTFGTRHFIGSSKMTILNYDNELDNSNCSMLIWLTDRRWHVQFNMSGTAKKCKFNKIL